MNNSYEPKIDCIKDVLFEYEGYSILMIDIYRAITEYLISDRGIHKPPIELSDFFPDSYPKITKEVILKKVIANKKSWEEPEKWGPSDLKRNVLKDNYSRYFNMDDRYCHVVRRVASEHFKEYFCSNLEAFITIN